MITMTPERWASLPRLAKLQLAYTMVTRGQTLNLDPSCDPDTVYLDNGWRTIALPLARHQLREERA